jgi:FtsX-like permease family
VFVVLGGVALASSVWTRVRRTAGADRPSRTIERAAQAGVGPTTVTGLRFAFERSADRTAGMGRSVALGAAVAVAALLGAITFGASLDDLVHEPSRFGWSGAITILAGDGYGNIAERPMAVVLDHDPDVEAWSGATFGEAEIDGSEVPLLGMDVDSAVAPPLLRGRSIQRDSEVVLGALTASQLGKDVGDQVTLHGAGPPVALVVVGIATLPTIGPAHASHTSLGRGALVTVEQVPGHEFDITGAKRGDFGPRGIFVRLRPDADVDAALVRLRRSTLPVADFSGLDVLGVQRPAEIIDADSIGSAPLVLASALALGSALSLVLALLAAVRRRRHDLAMLRTLGFTHRQLAATIAWQSTSIVLVGLLIGVPAGVVLGRTLWSAFGDELGVVVVPVVPWPLVAAVAGGAIVLAATVATLPGRAAGRTAARVTTDR